MGSFGKKIRFDGISKNKICHNNQQKQVISILISFSSCSSLENLFSFFTIQASTYMYNLSCSLSRELEKLLSTKYYMMKLLPIETRSQIFVPMIEMLDNLLVMGVVQCERDMQRLLSLLSPEKLSSNCSTCERTHLH